MKRYLMTVTTESGTVHLTAIARHCIDAMCIAYEAFGLCGVSVRLA